MTENKHHFGLFYYQIFENDGGKSLCPMNLSRGEVDAIVNRFSSRCTEVKDS